MYNLIIYIYLIGVAIYSLFNKKVKTMWQGERRAISDIKAKLVPSARYVWVHAASLGEFEQGRPIIERIRHEHPELKILLTFFSPSGYEVRKNYEGADIICYLPLDTPLNARRFLRTIRPVCAIFVKYEFWYNYLHILKHRGIPTYSVSSIFRKDQIFFRWYGRQYSRVLKCFTHFFVQNEESQRLLATLGIDNVTITGDTRFDRVLDIANAANDLPIVADFVRGRKVFIAGSSWLPDEEIFIPYFKDKPDWALVIAPHVIDESHLTKIEGILKANNITPLRYNDPSQSSSSLSSSSQSSSSSSSSSIVYRPSSPSSSPFALIINCFGLLSSIYRYADITYVGGGFGVGIHNVLEAAVWGKPVIFGPNNRRFKEAQDLLASGGGHEITSPDDFRRIMDTFLTEPAALKASSAQAAEYVASNSGATAAITEFIMHNS